MRERWRWTVFGVAVPLLVPALTFAAPPPLAARPPLQVGLDYDARAAPPDCPSEAELKAAIVQQLGYDPFALDAPRDLVVHVEIARGGTGTTAHIEWLSTSGRLEGERRLSSESEQCSEIASGVAFAVAVQLELRAGTSLPAAPVPPPPPAPSPAPRPAVAQKAPRPEQALLAGAGAYVQRGLQPETAGGLRAFGALRGRWWSLGLEAHGTLPTTQLDSSGAGFSSNVLGLGFSPCIRAAPLDTCLLGTVGRLAVSGEGVDQVRSPSAVVAGLGLRLQLGWPELERWGALIHVDAWTPLTPREVLVNREVVWASAPIVLAAGLDVVAIFR